MIQRIQSVFFLIAALLLAITMVVDLGSIEHNGLLYPILSTGLYDGQALNVFPTWGVVGIGSLAALISFVTVFLYKNRKLQIKLGYFAILLILFLYVTFYVYLMLAVDKFGTAEYYNVGWMMITLPFLSLIFIFFAIRSVKADEKLVKSLDRIR